MTRKSIADGKYHEVFISLAKDGESVKFIIDRNYQETFHFHKPITMENLEQINQLRIGKNEATGAGVQGCLYRLKIDSVLPWKVYLKNATKMTTYDSMPSLQACGKRFICLKVSKSH